MIGRRMLALQLSNRFSRKLYSLLRGRIGCIIKAVAAATLILVPWS